MDNYDYRKHLTRKGSDFLMDGKSYYLSDLITKGPYHYLLMDSKTHKHCNANVFVSRDCIIVVADHTDLGEDEFSVKTIPFKQLEILQ